MRWLLSFRSVEIWFEPWRPHWPYKRNFAHHYIYLPPGLCIRWGRSTRVMLKEQGATDAEIRRLLG